METHWKLRVQEYSKAHFYDSIFGYQKYYIVERGHILKTLLRRHCSKINKAESFHSWCNFWKPGEEKENQIKDHAQKEW